MILEWFPAAFLAGVLMFLAPCTLPIVPGYLAFIAGNASQPGFRGRVVRNATAFVVGFSIIFILLGTFAGILGAILFPWQSTLSRVGGAIIILFGLTMLGLFRVPLLSNERRIRVPKFLTIGRPESSFLIGVLFALGWSPCIGPILGTVLLIASNSSTVVEGGLLLGAFSLGLAVPFLLSAVLLEQASTLFSKWNRASVILSYSGGVLLIAIGLLMLFGQMGLLISWGYGLFDSWGYSTLLEYL